MALTTSLVPLNTFVSSSRIPVTSAICSMSQISPYSRFSSWDSITGRPGLRPPESFLSYSYPNFREEQSGSLFDRGKDVLGTGNTLVGIVHWSPMDPLILCLARFRILICRIGAGVSITTNIEDENPIWINGIKWSYPRARLPQFNCTNILKQCAGGAKINCFQRFERE